MSDSTNLADCLRNEQSTADDVPKETFCPAKKGDLSALERLYRQYGGSVYGLCLRIIGDPAEAEELTKQAFLKVFRKLHNVRKQSHVDAWLHRFEGSRPTSHSALRDTARSRSAPRPKS